MHDYRYFPEPDLVPLAPTRGDARRAPATRCPSCRPRGSSATRPSTACRARPPRCSSAGSELGQLLRGDACGRPDGGGSDPAGARRLGALRGQPRIDQGVAELVGQRIGLAVFFIIATRFCRRVVSGDMIESPTASRRAGRVRPRAADATSSGMLDPVDPALILAPMEGVTDAPMRAVQGAAGAFTFAVTEFLRVAHSVPPAGASSSATSPNCRTARGRRPGCRCRCNSSAATRAAWPRRRCACMRARGDRDRHQLRLPGPRP